MTERLRIYLAGPDVFLANAAEIFADKRALCDKYGFVGVSPFDNKLDLAGLSKHDAALHIAAANEQTIRDCNLVIANMTPFRGPSADPGTVYEMGVARALGLPVFAYTNLAGDLLERTRREFGGSIVETAPGRFVDSFGMAVEDFGLVDNLMMVGAVESSGSAIVVNPTNDDRRFTDLAGFEECLSRAARLRDTGAIGPARAAAAQGRAQSRMR